MTFLRIEPHPNRASQLFELNERASVVLHLSAVSINNIYYLVRKVLRHKTTKEGIVQALSNEFKDFEDSIQYSSALTIQDLNFLNLIEIPGIISKYSVGKLRVDFIVV